MSTICIYVYVFNIYIYVCVCVSSSGTEVTLLNRLGSVGAPSHLLWAFFWVGGCMGGGSFGLYDQSIHTSFLRDPWFEPGSIVISHPRLGTRVVRNNPVPHFIEVWD